MMFNVESFKRRHLIPLSKEQSNHELRSWLDTDLGLDLEKTDAVSFLSDDIVLACGGIRPYWEGRGQIWSVFSEKSKHNFVPVFRMLQRWVKYQITTNYHRLELSIDCSHPRARKRAELLGFTLETERARKYLPNGEDCSLYSMVRD